jgi:DNA-binding transcriptional ArsR family regulator
MVMAEQAVSFSRNGHGHLLNGNGLHNGSSSTGRHHAHGEGRQMTKVFKALSDGTRQEILRLLETSQRTVGEIVSNFHLSQPTISRHLSVLKEADLVVDQRHGQNVIYRLNDLALSASMREFFGQFRSCQSELR